MPSEDQADQISEFIRLGWMRWTPRSGMDLVLCVLALEEEEASGAPWEQPAEALAAKMFADKAGGLEGDPWHSDEFANLPPDERREEEEHESRFRERLERAARAHGLQGIASNRDCFDFLLRVAVIDRIEQGGLTFYRTARPLPIPVERIPMTEEERVEEDAFRWRELHEQDAQSVITLFVEKDFTTLVGTLRAVGDELGIDPESARHAILNLIAEGDFSPNRDVERLTPDEEFELTVDWDKFNESRISVRLKLPGEEAGD